MGKEGLGLDLARSATSKSSSIVSSGPETGDVPGPGDGEGDQCDGVAWLLCDKTSSGLVRSGVCVGLEPRSKAFRPGM